ncbi:ESPR domain-containing protein [Acidaminococcus intestini]|nr:hep/Hag repeat protein [Acidaminococcus intestini CAG:325]
MNKVYRVLWSQVKHAYVVVSEIAKNRTKHSRGKKHGGALCSFVV